MIFSIFFTVFSSFAHINPGGKGTPTLSEEEKLKFCKVNSEALGKGVRPFGIPNYFFKQMPGTSKILYNQKSQNMSIDIETGKFEKIPGTIDPVPSPDGLFLTVPQEESEGIKQWALAIYDTRGLNEKSRPVFIDNNFKGIYQSVGKLGHDHYRVITDFNGLKVKDYRVSRNPTTKALQVIPGKSRVLCPNLQDMTLKLPMLSKDGTKLSALDIDSGRTQIYTISPDGGCILKDTLPMMTGKADFTFDDSKIAFHASADQNNVEATLYHELGYQDIPTSTMALNVYVYDLKEKNITTSFGSSGGSNIYFPVFNEKNELTFLEQNTHDDYKFKKASIAAQNLSAIGPDECEENLDLNSETLVSLWALACKQVLPEKNIIPYLKVNIDPLKCKDMVASLYDRYEKNLKDHSKNVLEASASSTISKKDLIKACPNIPDKKKIPSSAPVPKSCIQCHMGANFDSPSPERRARIINMIKSKKMPPPGTGNPNETQRYLNYLEKLK